MRYLLVPYRAALRGGFRLTIVCVLQFVGVGVGTCSRHSLHHTDHNEMNTPRIVDSHKAACLPFYSIRGLTGPLPIRMEYFLNGLIRELDFEHMTNKMADLIFNEETLRMHAQI